MTDEKMAIIPIHLEGDKLGKRHKQINNLVNEAFRYKVPFDSIRDIPENSAVDRLIKIDLAAKYRNVEYILQTLKDDDMLYVSRAMKCTWLVNDEKYVDIINPINLERNLYQDMRTNAANKMKHWILLNIKNETRAKEFYEYYKKDEIDYAIKFLPKCSVDLILREVETIPEKNITPRFLKMLCERSPKAAEIYFKNIKKDAIVGEHYILNMQILRKIDPELYIYVIEHYFLEDYKKLNTKATQFVMKNHRDKFDAKPELYTVRILNMPEMTKFLNSDTSKDLIVKLARANYIRHYWFQFNYEFAKPLLQLIEPNERSKFGTKIFKEEKYGEGIEEPPYPIPTRIKKNTHDDENITLDKLNANYNAALKDPPRRQLLCRGGGGGYRFRTELDKIFDEYRFKSFEKTFVELQKRIPKESKIDMRQNMMLVLVSKTGGRTESVEVLIQYLLEKHSNEPINVRAAIVRSFVKRAFAWRWTDTNWKLLLKFGHDLGLDGSISEVKCNEGLHAIILRRILLNDECPKVVWENFIDTFSPLNEYKLNFSERCLLHQQLPALLLSAAKKAPQNPEITIKRLTEVCNALEVYKLKIATYPGVLEAIAAFAAKEVSLAKPLLLKLFKSGIGRKILFIPNFEIINTDSSYLNVLRHDSSLLTDKKFEDLLENNKNLHHDLFLRKLALYFDEEGGIAKRYMELLKHKARDQPNVKLARPMALLTGAHAITWPTFEEPKNDVQLQKKYRKMINCLQNNSHLARVKLSPPLNLKGVNLTALANWIHTCSPKALRDGLESLLVYPRHARLTLALRTANVLSLIAKTLPYAARSSPMRSFRIVLRILRRKPQIVSPQDFGALKSLIPTINLKGYNFKGYCKLVMLNDIPELFRAEYAVLMYQTLAKLGFGPERDSKSHPYYRIAIPLIMCMINHINELDITVVMTILKEFLDKVFIKDIVEKYGRGENEYRHEEYCDFQGYFNIFMEFIARFLITSTSEVDMNNRILEIYIPFEQKVKEMWDMKAVNANTSYGFGHFENFLKGVLSPKVFLNERDFSLIFLNKLCSFGDEIAPMMHNVGLNYCIRFIRLFRQAVKLSVKKQPDLFSSGKVEGGKAVNCVMTTFGEVTAEDVESLVSIYFPTIRMFYINALMMFLSAHRLRYYDSVILGLLNDESKTNAVVIGISSYNSEYNYRSKEHANEKIEQRIRYLMKNAMSREIKFYHKFSDLSYSMGSGTMI